MLKADGVIARDLQNVKVERVEEQTAYTRKEIEIDEQKIIDQQVANAEAALNEEIAMKEQKLVKIEESLIADHFVKVAKRSKAWLLAINEQGKLEPRSRQVDNAIDSTVAIVNRQIGPIIKERLRKDQVMGDEEIDDWLERLAEASYEGVGKIRVDAFCLNDIYELYPPSRLHFDYQQMVYNEHFDDTIDELAN